MGDFTAIQLHKNSLLLLYSSTVNCAYNSYLSIFWLPESFPHPFFFLQSTSALQRILCLLSLLLPYLVWPIWLFSFRPFHNKICLNKKVILLLHGYTAQYHHPIKICSTGDPTIPCEVGILYKSNSFYIFWHTGVCQTLCLFQPCFDNNTH